MATDPEYRDWFEKHDTLVFTAQMDGAHGRAQGPDSLLKRIRDEIEVDLYPTIRDFVGRNGGASLHLAS